MKKKPVIQIKGISKSFVIPHTKTTTLIERIRGVFQKSAPDTMKALDTIDLTVNEGEMIGIIGGNGSGKSTLLKILAGIYRPDHGTVTISGSIAPFLELGVGFHPELTGRENVFLNGLILGMSRKYIAQKFDSIIAFAELERFIDLPLKNYSSGMQVRLAFAIAFAYKADMYLMDEVLAVGDAHFQKKSFAAFKDLRKAGKTIILVSHDLESVRTLCDRVVWLKNGVVQGIGDPAEMVGKYATDYANRRDV